MDQLTLGVFLPITSRGRSIDEISWHIGTLGRQLDKAGSSAVVVVGIDHDDFHSQELQSMCSEAFKGSCIGLHFIFFHEEPEGEFKVMNFHMPLIISCCMQTLTCSPPPPLLPPVPFRYLPKVPVFLLWCIARKIIIFVLEAADGSLCITGW